MDTKPRKSRTYATHVCLSIYARPTYASVLGFFAVSPPRKSRNITTHVCLRPISLGMISCLGF